MILTALSEILLAQWLWHAAFTLKWWWKWGNTSMSVTWLLQWIIKKDCFYYTHIVGPPPYTQSFAVRQSFLTSINFSLDVILKALCCPNYVNAVII